METVTVLKLLAEAASACNISANDYVTRDETSPPLHGGSAIVYSGSLRTQAQVVALKSLRLSPVGDNKAVDIQDIADGLQYLHNQEILHGDLRGRNVLISEDGHALLADYGLSTLIETSFDTTAAVPIHPTVRWIAPEQIDNDGKVTIQGDVWAFGMTALELFTRRPPYYDIPDTRSVILRILDRPPSRPSDESACFRMTDACQEHFSYGCCASQ
ncbi:hypothetical protein ID866_9307 [Astraeus odoratus]|nr:hypothetical protein ID866_9307 [Astraeus odoratus]